MRIPSPFPYSPNQLRVCGWLERPQRLTLNAEEGVSSTTISPLDSINLLLPKMFLGKPPIQWCLLVGAFAHLQHGDHAVDCDTLSLPLCWSDNTISSSDKWAVFYASRDWAPTSSLEFKDDRTFYLFPSVNNTEDPYPSVLSNLCKTFVEQFILVSSSLFTTNIYRRSGITWDSKSKSQFWASFWLFRLNWNT